MPDEELRVVLYKRWRLRDGVSMDRVTKLVTDRVVPHYRKLCEETVLGLEALDENTVLTTQRWPSRAVLDQATSGDRFEDWWRGYQPILSVWDSALEFEDEWESHVVLG